MNLLPLKEERSLAIRMVNIMFGLNQHWGALFGNLTTQKIVPDSTFQTFRFFNDYEDFSRLGWNFSFQRNQPFLFSANFRQEIFHKTMGLMYPRSMCTFLTVHNKVSRDNVLNTVGSIVSEKDKYSHWLFKFENEDGEGLGPTKEFYTKFSHDMCRYDLNLWISEPQISSDKMDVASPCRLFPSPCLKPDSNARDILTANGIIMAKALLEKKMMDLNFSNALYKCIIGGCNNLQHLNLNDPKDVMPSLVKFVDGLVEVMNEALRIKNDTSLTSEQQQEATSNLKCDGYSFEDLCINFTLPGFPSIETVEGGADKFLSADNIEEYLKLLVWWFMYKGPQEKIECIKAGFESILDEIVLSNIAAEDLEKLLCGTREKPWTVSKLMQNCMLRQNLELKSPFIMRLFEVLSSFSSEEQRLFLIFVTGSPNLPIGGLASLMPKLSIRLGCCKGDPNNYLPRAFTCTHLLEIQKYTKKQILRKNLLKAIKECQNSISIV